MSLFSDDLKALSDSDLDWLDDISDRFERDWRSGGQPQIERLLDAADESQRTLLLHELIRQEFELRSAGGERPTLSEYRRRFPAISADTTAWLEEQFLTTALSVLPSSIDTSQVHAGADAETTLPSAPSATARNTSSDVMTISKVFGRYTIEREVGRGGMGAVFLAQDRQLGRRVALKIPYFKPEEGLVAIERFFREARAMAVLEHPNLCPIYDVGEIDGRHFISMAFIEGCPLSELVSASALRVLSIRDGVKLLHKVALALHKAHQAGVVHRDLKPSNIMIRLDGDPVVMDFGLAKMNQLQEIDLTQSGSLVGSPAYMSPEQVEARNDEIGPPTDVYSLGVILYQMLCGRRPYEGSIASVLGQIIEKTPALPSSFTQNVDSELEAICMKAIAKAPKDRYSSALEMAELLEEFLRRADSAILSGSINTTRPYTHSASVAREAALAAAPTATSTLPRRTGPLEILIASVVAIALLVGMLVLRGRDGEYIITANDPLIAQQLASDGVISVRDRKTQKPYQLKVGANRLPIDNYDFAVTAPDGLELDLSQFQIKRNDKVTATLRAIAKAEVVQSVPAVTVKPAVVAAEPATARVAEDDYALEFDGAWSHVSIPSLNRDDSTPGTIEAWVSAENQPHARAILSWGGKARMQLTCRSYFFVHDATTGCGEIGSVAESTIPGLRWTHLAYSADSHEGRMYLNGQLVSRCPRQNSPSTAAVTGTWIGGHPSAANPNEIAYFFKGVIDEARISQVSRYSEDFTPPKRFEADADTLALYHFDEGKSDVLRDASGHGNDGKIIAAKWVPSKLKLEAVLRPSLLLPEDQAALARLKSHPLLSPEWEWSTPENLGRQIYPQASIHEPFVTHDELTLLFRDQGNVMHATRSSLQEPFGVPKPLIQGLSIFPSLSEDRLTLWACSSIGGSKFDIWQKTRQSTAESFGARVVPGPEFNSVASDGQATLSRDGLTVVFCSDRAGGLGNDDFWMSTRKSIDDPFPAAVHLGPKINSPEPDFTPMLCLDDCGLLFASRRQGGSGSFDLWIALRPDKAAPFQSPMPLAHINSQFHENRPCLSADGRTLYFESGRPGGDKNADLWQARRVPKATKAPFDAQTAQRQQANWATHLGTPAEIQNSIGMKLRLVPPGEFEMGFQPGAMAQPEDKPRHAVKLTKPFYIGSTEVTVRHFRQFVEATNYKTVVEATGEGAKGVDGQARPTWNWRLTDWHGPAMDDHPVNCIAWPDARNFCDWLTKQEPGRTYRLPTDAEWEMAARAGSNADYWWGNEADPARANAVGKNVMTPLSNAESGPTNPYGLHHVLGNIWEWCLDGRRTYSEDSVTDPLGPLGAEVPRVGRGGAISSQWLRLRCSTRVADDMTHATPVTGFRVLLEVK